MFSITYELAQEAYRHLTKFAVLVTLIAAVLWLLRGGTEDIERWLALQSDGRYFLLPPGEWQALAAAEQVSASTTTPSQTAAAFVFTEVGAQLLHPYSDLHESASAQPVLMQMARENGTVQVVAVGPDGELRAATQWQTVSACPDSRTVVLGARKDGLSTLVVWSRPGTKQELSDADAMKCVNSALSVAPGGSVTPVRQQPRRSQDTWYWAESYDKHKHHNRQSVPITRFEQQGRWGYRNSERVIQQPRFAQASMFRHGLAVVQSADGMGVVNEHMQWVWRLPNTPQAAPWHMPEASATHTRSVTQWRIIDAQGDALPVPVPNPDTLQRLNGAWLTHGDDGQQAWFDESGAVRQRLQLRGQIEGPFAHGLAPARSADSRLMGFVDVEGRWVIEPRYEKVEGYVNKVARVLMRNGSDQPWRLIDLDGQPTASPGAATMADDDLSEGLRPGADNGRWGFLNKDGQWIIAPAYEDALPFSQGLAAVKVGGLWGYIGQTGKFTIAPRFEQADGFAGKVARTREPHQVRGLIDRSGQAVRTEPAFLDIREFSQGLAAARIAEGRWGYIDDQGRWAIRPVYEEARDFDDGYATVLEVTSDQSTSPRTPLCAELLAGILPNGWIAVHRCGRYALLNQQGQWLIPARLP